MPPTIDLHLEKFAIKVVEIGVVWLRKHAALTKKSFLAEKFSAEKTTGAQNEIRF